MGSGESLLERLRCAGAPSTSVDGDERRSLERSVARNIQRILAARQGHAPAQMDFGVPSPAEVVNLNKDGLGMMQGLLKAAIERYEPRLCDVQVLQVETGGESAQILFSIRGKLAYVADQPLVSFDAFITVSGQLRLKE